VRHRIVSLRRLGASDKNLRRDKDSYAPAANNLSAGEDCIQTVRARHELLTFTSQAGHRKGDRLEVLITLVEPYEQQKTKLTVEMMRSLRKPLAIPAASLIA
jgi:antitoxin component HigA of HigAB toxin-antitoxin module